MGVCESVHTYRGVCTCAYDQFPLFELHVPYYQNQVYTDSKVLLTFDVSYVLIAYDLICFTVIKKQNTLVCQFASPLDVDTHVKPEVTFSNRYLNLLSPILYVFFLNKIFLIALTVLNLTNIVISDNNIRRQILETKSRSSNSRI